MVGYRWSPRQFGLCSGALLPISTNSALFSLIGTIYGGDGRITFALPDMRGRAAVGYGHGTGLSNYTIGQRAGIERESLDLTHLPAHNHAATFTPTGAEPITISVRAVSQSMAGANQTDDPTNAYWAQSPPSGPGQADTYSLGPSDVNMAADAVTVTGGGGSGTVTIGNTGSGQPINLIQPVIAINYVMCMQGIYPSRN